MNLFTTLITAVGVILASISGLVCYVGPNPAQSSLSFLPNSATLLQHPEAALAIGGVLVLVGLFSAPSRT